MSTFRPALDTSTVRADAPIGTVVGTLSSSSTSVARPVLSANTVRADAAPGTTIGTLSQEAVTLARRRPLILMAS